MIEKVKKFLQEFLKQGNLVPDIKITNQFAQELENKCARVHAHDFVGFVRQGINPILSSIYMVSPQSSQQVFADKKFDSTKENIQSVLGEFYETYLPEKAEEAKQILSGNHPLFVDENGNSTIKFTPTDLQDNRGGSVGHRGHNKFLEYEVRLKGRVGDLTKTAHETAHALSSHHQMIVKDPSKVPPNTFENDCVGEIEALISEKLVNRFLVEKGIYTKEDVENYRKGEENSLLCECNLIKEETDILMSMSPPITKYKLKTFLKDAKRKNAPQLVERVSIMHDEERNSPYMFRYVVGRVVSDVFMDRFEKASKQQQQEMLKNYQTYLDHTNEFELDDACNFLLGQPFYQIAEERNKIMESKNQKVFEQDEQRQLPKAQKPKLSTKIKETVLGR